MADLDDVRRIALALPEVTERPSHGTPGFRVRDKLLARLAEPDLLVAFVADLGEKEALLQSAPDRFTTTPHYDGHPSVLVRLSAIDGDELAEVLADAWRARAPKRLRDAHADAAD